jgi:aminoglycoside 6'-N-acetyltransferase
VSAACSDGAAPGGPLFLTERLLVRRYGPEDLAEHLRLRADPEVRRFMHWSDHDPAGVAAYLDAAATRAVPDDRGWINLAVVRRADARLVGDHGVKVERGVACLGLALMPEARRQGYAAELVRGAIAWLRDAGVGRFVAEIDFGNAASFALFLGLGFRVAAERRDEFGPFSVLVAEA